MSMSVSANVRSSVPDRSAADRQGCIETDIDANQQIPLIRIPPSEGDKGGGLGELHLTRKEYFTEMYHE